MLTARDFEGPNDRAPRIAPGERWPFVNKAGLLFAARPGHDVVPKGVPSFNYGSYRLVPLPPLWKWPSSRKESR